MSYSIVIPSRDEASVVACVDFFAERSIHCDEVVVVWNGSPENSPHFNKTPIPVRLLYCQGMDVYAMYNYGLLMSKNEFVMLVNDDMIPMLGFDITIQDAFSSLYNVVTFQLVESGYIAVNNRNIYNNFGTSYADFDEGGFTNFGTEYLKKRETDFVEGIGWYMPVVFSKTYFLEMGGYPTKKPFPHPADIEFFKILDNPKTNFIKMEYLVYHFQRLSQRISNSKPGDFLRIEVAPANILSHEQHLNYSGKPKLNLCCGDDKREGYLNVDIANSDYNIDLTSGMLPFPNDHFEEIIWIHGIEHFRFERAIELLVELKRILHPSGRLIIASPELSLSVSDYRAGENRFPNCAPAINRIFGLNTSEEQVHRYGYTCLLDRENNIYRILERCGYQNTNQLTPKHRDEWMIETHKVRNV